VAGRLVTFSQLEGLCPPFCRWCCRQIVDRTADLYDADTGALVRAVERSAPGEWRRLVTFAQLEGLCPPFCGWCCRQIVDRTADLYDADTGALVRAAERSAPGEWRRASGPVVAP
jgi:hypothetical protein